jgi:NAD(P)-dependent dehydrogenase (short-subunit alcohol dehydrogenase family)
MLTCDVTDDAPVAKLVDDALAAAGRIDLLANNAGIGLLGGVEESSIAHLNRERRSRGRKQNGCFLRDYPKS